MASDSHYHRSIRFHSDQLTYTVAIRKRPWWLLWLLLILLLLIRCERDITVVVTETKTHQPVPAIPTTLDYTAHFLYKDGRLFANEHHHYQIKTDSEGQAKYEGLECSVFSYIFYCLSKVTATSDVVNSQTKNFHTTRYFYFNITELDCDIDIVMCIDNTFSMDGLIDMVKENALKFYKDIKTSAVRHKRNVHQMRVQIISFGDLKEKKIQKSRFFNVPAESEELGTFVNSIYAEGGGDSDENGLEALSMAMDNDWVTSDLARRHIIVLYTDAGAHELDNPFTHTKYYPENMPANFQELTERWNSMDPESRRLVIYGPKEYPWKNINRKWGNVNHLYGDLNSVISGESYNKIVEDIVKTL